MKFIWLLFYLQWSACNAQKQPHFQGERTSMVHLFEWTWPAIAKECEEFLGPNGYGGVQISPPTECRLITQPSRPWWERYQPISYHLQSRSGNEAQLMEMIKRCNSAGVRIYVDVVFNHMTDTAFGQELIGIAGSHADYETRQYPAVPYGPNDFNEQCSIQNYQNIAEVRNCQLGGLLDLNQGKAYVRETIVKLMNRLIDMGVAGFRIDAAKHMWPQHLANIYGDLHNLSVKHGFEAAARPFIYQEVIDLGVEPIKSTDYNSLGCVTEFKHSAELSKIFRLKNDLKWLHNWGTQWSMLPSNDAFVFIDNHDNQRGHGAGGADILTHKNGAAYKMALIFMLAHPYGQVTRIMSSYAFNDTDQGPPTTTMQHTPQIADPTFDANGQCNANVWICEHRWPEVQHMIEFRNVVAATHALENWWDNGRNQIAFSRGALGFVAINMETEQKLNLTLQTGLPAGIYCDVISGRLDRTRRVCSGLSVTIANDGLAALSLPQGPSALALHVRAKL